MPWKIFCYSKETLYVASSILWNPFLLSWSFLPVFFLSTLGKNPGKCDIVNSRVFSSRRHFRRFKVRQRTKRKRRLKRDRSLLALSGPKYWPRWCNKVAFFRVFRQDFTLCLYTHRFKNDPILAYSNPNIGTTIYGYKDKKHYQEMGKIHCSK